MSGGPAVSVSMPPARQPKPRASLAEAGCLRRRARYPTECNFHDRVTGRSYNWLPLILCHIYSSLGFFPQFGGYENTLIPVPRIRSRSGPASTGRVRPAYGHRRLWPQADGVWTSRQSGRITTADRGASCLLRPSSGNARSGSKLPEPIRCRTGMIRRADCAHLPAEPRACRRSG